MSPSRSAVSTDSAPHVSSVPCPGSSSAASQRDTTANVLHSLPAHRRKRMRELFDFFDKARP